MKFFLQVWILCMTLCCIKAPQVNAFYPALSFVLFEDVYELEDIQSFKNRDVLPLHKQTVYFSHMFSSCPPMSDQQYEINFTSITKNCLFIRNDVIFDIKNAKEPSGCPTEYKVSVVPVTVSNEKYIKYGFDEKPSDKQEYRIGFEVWDVEGILKKYNLPPMKRIEGLKEGSGWIGGLSVLFNKKNIMVKQVRYELHSPHRVPGICKDYELGKEILKDYDVQKLYYLVKQKAALSNIIRPLKPRLKRKAFHLDTPPKVTRLPETPSGVEPENNSKLKNTSGNVELHSSQNSAPIDEHDLSHANTLLSLKNYTSSPIPPKKKFTPKERPLKDIENYSEPSRFKPPPQKLPLDEPTFEYFKMVQLAPIEHFDVSSIRKMTCTYFNTAPMWETIASKVWGKVNFTIQRLLDVISNLFIIAGTHDILELRTKSGHMQKIFLDPSTKTVPVPRLFWKFVAYKAFSIEENPIPFYYGIIIVIHNELTEPTNKICEVDACPLYGWDVKSDYDGISSPYCCYITNYILELLNIQFDSALDDFNLNKVVVKIKNDGKILETRNYNALLNSYAPVQPSQKEKDSLMDGLFGN